MLHFAALKSVGHSNTIPLDYYATNITGTLNVLECMNEYKVKNIIFSSSSTVYGVPSYLPLDEKCSLKGSQISSPYGRTKYTCELILKDLYASDDVCVFFSLFYSWFKFNFKNSSIFHLCLQKTRSKNQKFT